MQNRLNAMTFGEKVSSDTQEKQNFCIVLNIIQCIYIEFNCLEEK